MGRDLIPEEVEIHPRLAAPSLGAIENAAVEIASGLKIAYEKGEVERRLRHGYGCDICQDVCPYNIRFAKELKVPEFAPRAVLESNDARTIAKAILAMTQEEFTVAFKGSPMKRAKLNGLKRNATVVLAAG